MRTAIHPLLFLLTAVASGGLEAQQPAPPPINGPERTILAIGAHAGDMELTTGAVLLQAHERGDRVVLLHLTLGEGGNPKLTPAAYGEQKRREALSVAQRLGAEVIFGPYKDGEIPNDESARRYVADVMRTVRPTMVITHWKESLHKDHSITSAIVQEAVLLAALPGVQLAHPAHRGIRTVWYADNWEDATNFTPFVYIKVSDQLAAWRAAVSEYEFARGAIAGFPYVDYYTALATVRGAVVYKGQAVAFAVEPEARRRVLDSLP
ncbi:MAG: PIG-L family deacetylase [Gemmatimonadaceae bacterium]|nr:PIG-L family deacetylase [Gemmatimonadaceae bacterium]